MQRFFDIIFSSVGLIMLSPIMIPTALILRLTGEGEVFFIQERIGHKGELFGLFKFATMLKDSPNIGSGTITVAGDPRILPIGGLLRKSKLNELPQLLNIFFGHMSVIGPRPLTEQGFSLYDYSTQLMIKKVRPGLSGVQQVVIRDEESLVDLDVVPESFYASILAPYKGKLEQWFVMNNSLNTYFKSIFMTVWIILTPKNSVVWRVFKDLPEPPSDLKEALNYTSR
jgi:lipopolysaccharide/colanic/teichoic acid biosynthesis glycosyltransferase